MSQLSTFFQQKIPIFERLLPFGFTVTDGLYTYREVFFDGQFELLVQVDEGGKSRVAVLDVEMGEEYMAVHVTAPLGAFVSQVKEASISILQKVATACFCALPFAQEQANRLSQFIQQEWADQADYPFANYPQTASFRHPANGKWYALITRVKRSYFGDSSDTSQVEILNLKVDREEMAELLSLPGVYPAYHMSKKTWVSLLLDGSIADQTLFDLVKKSRSMVGPKTYRSEEGPDYWLIPANPRLYDIDSEFAASKRVSWPQKASLQTGDILAIYVTTPVQAIRYVCRVLAANLPNYGEPDIPADKRVMQIELLDRLPDQELPIQRMKELGVKAVRGPRRMTKELKDVLVSKINRVH